MDVDLRRARREDLPDIVRLLAEGSVSPTRERYETPLPASYLRAFDAIEADPNNELIVGSCAMGVVGVLQLTFIPYLTYQGSWRALIEGLRVDTRLRSQGLGGRLVGRAIARARERGCRIVQLTTHKSRGDAKRFYERLGFVASHEGLKLELAP